MSWWIWHGGRFCLYLNPCISTFSVICKRVQVSWFLHAGKINVNCIARWFEHLVHALVSLVEYSWFGWLNCEALSIHRPSRTNANDPLSQQLSPNCDSFFTASSSSPYVSLTRHNWKTWLWHRLHYDGFQIIVHCVLQVVFNLCSNNGIKVVSANHAIYENLWIFIATCFPSMQKHANFENKSAPLLRVQPR